jgi:hypothetical protein
MDLSIIIDVLGDKNRVLGSTVSSLSILHCDILGRFSLVQNEKQYNNPTPTTVFHLYAVLLIAVRDSMYPQFWFYVLWHLFVGGRVVMESETSFIDST